MLNGSIRLYLKRFIKASELLFLFCLFLVGCKVQHNCILTDKDLGDVGKKAMKPARLGTVAGMKCMRTRNSGA